MVDRTSVSDKSPRESPEAWENDKKRDKASLLLVRGRLYQKLNELQSAQKDYEESYALQPSAMAAMKLGELAELRKDQIAASRMSSEHSHWPAMEAELQAGPNFERKLVTCGVCRAAQKMD